MRRRDSISTLAALETTGAALTAAGALFVVSCALPGYEKVGQHEATIASVGVGPGAGGGAPSGAGGSQASYCPTGSQSGAPMVQVPAVSGGAYCVDATEVTNEHYEAFLVAQNKP